MCKSDRILAIISFVFIFGLCFMIIFSMLNAEVRYTIGFNEKDIIFNKSDGFDIVNIKKCILAGDTGAPLLPVKRIEILIPPNKKCIDVHSENIILSHINGNFKLHPSQPPVPLNTQPREWEVIIDTNIYNSSEQLPQKNAIFQAEEKISGNKIVSVDIIPLCYSPRNGSISIIKEITLVLELQNDSQPFLCPIKRTEFSQHFINSTIGKRIYNEKQLSSYIRDVEIESFNKCGPENNISKPKTGDTPLDLIIITSPELKGYFNRLVEIKNERGIISKVITTDWIIDNYTGRDKQECIRNFIKEAYIYWGVTWIIFAGDIVVVPTRFIDFKGWEWNGLIPTDLYYSDLDGDWDANGNGIFGEYEYGNNIDSIDGNPDVFVGRLPVETEEEIDRYTDKVKSYEIMPDMSYLKRVLFLGASIYSNGTDGWGAQRSEYIIDNYLPSDIEPYKLYAPKIDSLQSPPRWYGDELLSSNTTITQINQGYNIINHIDHGAYDAIGTGIFNGGGYLHWYDADALINSTKPSILWSISCSPNAYDLNCVSEHFANSSCGLAFIGNSRLGWTSQAFQDNAFFQSIYNDSITNLGGAFASTLYGSLYYRVAMNLLGDPSVFIWTDTPTNLSVDYKKSLIVPVDSIVFFVSQNGVPVKNARVVVSKKNEDITRISLTDEAGRAVIFLTCKRTGILSISVSYENALSYYDSVSVTESQEPYVFLKPYRRTVESGTKNSIYIPLKNNGGKTAERVQAVASSSDPYISLSDSLLKFGDILPRKTKMSTKPFIAKIEPGCPQNRQIPIDIRIFDRDNNVWFDTLVLNVGIDSLSYNGHSPIVKTTINQADTCAESFLIPSIKIKNRGDFTSNNISVKLRTTDSLVSLMDSTIYIDSIPAHITYETKDGFSFISTCSLDTRFTIAIIEKDDIYTQDIEFNSPFGVDLINGESKQNSIQIRWNLSDEPGILGYNLYRKENGLWKKIVEVPVKYSTYEDCNIIPGKTYWYTVTAIDSSYNESKRTDSLSAASNPPLLAGWPCYIGPGGYSVHSGQKFYDKSSPGYGDIDGDGAMELVVGSNDSNIYAYNPDGSQQNGFPVEIGFRIENSPALCDLDNDGKDEIIIGGGYSDSAIVYIFTGDGALFLPSIWPIKTGNYPTSSPIVDDIDGDGDFEIGIGSNGNEVHFWNIDGTPVAGWPVSVNKPVCIATADIDGDSFTDIVISSKNGIISVYNWDGTEKNGWPQTPTGNIYSGHSLADVDNDGQVEIVVGTSTKKLFIYNSDGTSKQGFPVDVADRIAGIPAIGDVNGDDNLEIAVSTTANQYYIFNSCGEELFSTDKYNHLSNYFLSPILVDLNNDGKKDLLVSNVEGYAFGFDSIGNCINGFPIFYGNGSFSPPVFGDINRDGNMELIIKGSDKKLYVYSTLAKQTSSYGKWFKMRANNRNTCYFGEEPGDGTLIPDSDIKTSKITFLNHPYPNPFSGSVSINCFIGKNTERAELRIYDISGRLLKTYHISDNGQGLPERIEWNGKTKSGNIVSSGIYFVKLFVDLKDKTHTVTRKIIKLSGKKENFNNK
jgi:hypothetical protein